MDTKYTLYYFPIKGLAEPIRLLLSYGKIEFEDVRISKEDWPKQKESMPMGQMPVLQVGDKKVFQSTAICRYLGKKVGLAGSDDWQAMEIDIAVDTIHDLRMKVAQAFYEADEKIKEEKFKALSADTIPFLLKKLNEMAASGYMALGKLTWGDLLFAGVYDYLKTITRLDIGAQYPNLKKVVDNVNTIPQIKTWIENSPKSDW